MYVRYSIVTVEHISSYKLVNTKNIKVMNQTQPVLSSQPHICIHENKIRGGMYLKQRLEFVISPFYFTSPEIIEVKIHYQQTNSLTS